MRLGLHRNWLVGIASLAGVVLATGSLWLLRSEKSRVATLQAEIEGKEEALGSHPLPPQYAASPQEMETALGEWRTMAGNEALRLAELSAVARNSGATIASLKTLELENSADGRIASCAYRLDLRGRYEQLASFCDGLYASRGLAAIDDLAIEPEEPSGESGILQASLQIAWYAPGPSVMGELEAASP